MQSCVNIASRDRLLQAELPVWERDASLVFPGWVDETPEWPIPAVRGLLGYALKDYCLREKKPHLYHAIFKPGSTQPPRLLIRCERGSGGLSSLHLTLRVLGRDHDWLDDCCRALIAYEAKGLGPARIPYRLRASRVRSVTPPWTNAWNPVWGGRFRIHFTTPAQLHLSNVPVGPETPSRLANEEWRRAFCHALVLSSARRLLAPKSPGRPCGLAAGGRENEGRHAIELDRLLPLVDNTVITRYHLEWVDEEWQGRFIGGITGFIDLETPPLLEQVFASAELTAVGRSIAYGCGQVRLAAP